MDPQTRKMSDVVLPKVVGFFVLGLMGFGFSYLPKWMIKLIMRKEAEAERILSLGNALAGDQRSDVTAGIFLGSGFNHMLPEAAELFEETGVDWKIPMSTILSAFGFLLVFFLEKVLFLSHPATSVHPKKNGQHDRLLEKPDDSATVVSPSDSTTEQVETSVPDDTEVVPLDDEGGEAIPMQDLSKKESTGHDHDHAHVDLLKQGGALPYLLMTILSVHSIIAGLALGIQIEDVWPVFIALAAHKWVEAFAMGVNLLKNKVSSKLFLRCVLFYTSMVPAGIVIGALLSLALSHHVAVYLEAFVTAIASGTFIYISLVDVLLVEFAVASDKYWKYAITIFGFVLITLAVLLFDDD